MQRSAFHFRLAVTAVLGAAPLAVAQPAPQRL